MESVVHIVAKQMMLRDLRGHLDDWEEGKYTYLDQNQVWLNISGIFRNWEHYASAAESQAEPEQLPLPEIPGHIPDGALDEQLREEHDSEIDEEYFNPPGKGSVGVNF